MNQKYLTNPPKTRNVITWILFCILIGMCVTIIPSTKGAWLDLMYYIAISILGLLWIYTYWHYPILHKDRIEIKNLIFFSFNFKYENIKQIDIVNSAKGPIIIIKLKDKSLSRRFCIDAVDNNDLDNLAIELQQKGINTIRKRSPFD